MRHLPFLFLPHADKDPTNPSPYGSGGTRIPHRTSTFVGPVSPTNQVIRASPSSSPSVWGYNNCTSFQLLVRRCFVSPLWLLPAATSHFCPFPPSSRFLALHHRTARQADTSEGIIFKELSPEQANNARGLQQHSFSSIPATAITSCNWVAMKSDGNELHPRRERIQIDVGNERRDVFETSLLGHKSQL